MQKVKDGQQKSIIYVNFAQYDNAGRLLDFLREHFLTVAHFSYDHLRLKNARPSSHLRVYENGKLVKEIKLIRLRLPEPFLFTSLPLVAIFMIVQTILYTYFLKKRYKTFDLYLSPNAFTAWIGNMIRNFGFVKKTVFWVWDYFPSGYPDWRIRFARWVYWKFDKPAILHANRIVFTNERLLRFRKEMDILAKRKSYSVVPICTKLQIYSPSKENCVIGFLGMLKRSQGLELLFDTLSKLVKHVPSVKIEIIGTGPDEDYFRARAKRFSNLVTFHGYIENEDSLHNYISRWTIGIATYKPEISNESYWGDPSKIKVYLASSVPVITTDVSYMTGIIKKNKAGVIINYNNHRDFIDAVKTIIKNKASFQKNAYRLARKYDYRKLYPKLFIDKRNNFSSID